MRLQVSSVAVPIELMPQTNDEYHRHDYPECALSVPHSIELRQYFLRQDGLPRQHRPELHLTVDSRSGSTSLGLQSRQCHAAEVRRYAHHLPERAGAQNPLILSSLSRQLSSVYSHIVHATRYHVLLPDADTQTYDQSLSEHTGFQVALNNPVATGNESHLLTLRCCLPVPQKSADVPTLQKALLLDGH